MSRFQAFTASGEAVDYPDDAPVVDVDVREDLRAGREPFGKIMSAVGALKPEEVLCVRATFAPAPLLAVLAERGYVNHMESQAEDDWSVWFWRPILDTTIELDVRVIPPRDKHPTIFRTFDGLSAGQAMLLINDHDPAPLRYQLLAERKNLFDWVYEEEGPDTWRVRITHK